MKISRGSDEQGTSSEISRKNQCKTDYVVDFETDFLISPGDVYPNRKVELEDAEILEETRKKFEEMCERHPEAFSKNKKNIGWTTLIEMEIDTGDSLPVAQNPYTLLLKHHEWVRKEIETLQKAGVIERSLSPWASPLIVVPKKSVPDEPLRRRLCVDYRKVNALQQEVKRTDRGTGCLSLYSSAKNRRNVRKTKRNQMFLNNRFTNRLLPHWFDARIQSEICICGPDGKVGIQADSIRTQPGPRIFSAANR